MNRVLKDSFKRALNNPVIRCMVSVLYFTALIWLLAVFLEYVVFCAGVTLNTDSILVSPNVIAVKSLEGYDISGYTRVCIGSPIYVINETIAALPVSMDEFLNVVTIPIITLVIVHIMCMVIISQTTSKKLRSVEIISFLLVVNLCVCSGVIFTKTLFSDALPGALVLFFMVPLGIEDILFMKLFEKK